MGLSIVILAAGEGKRMFSQIPKILHPIAGIPMLEWVVKTAMQLDHEALYVISGHGATGVEAALADYPITWVQQKQQLGTGHALSQVMPLLTEQGQVLILFGDVPLISQNTLQRLCEMTPVDSVGLLLAEFPDPSGFGRVIRDSNQQIIKIIEHKDATEQQRKIREIFTGMMLAPAKQLQQWLPVLGNDNAQGEYYLTDIVAMAVKQNTHVTSILVEDEFEARGVNDRNQLVQLERIYQSKVAKTFLLSGTTIIDPDRFDLRGELKVGIDVTIDINVVLEGTVSIGQGSTIGPNCIIKNSTIGEGVMINANSIIEDSEIGDDCIVGPNARLRPATVLDNQVHIGNFVEVKKSTIGQGTKINHLSYIGDAIIGKEVNVGAGTITCNYDGVEKHQTVIEDNVFIGSDTQLIAPVTVGAGAIIGAGATIRKNVCPGEMTINDTHQVTLKDGKKRTQK